MDDVVKEYREAVGFLNFWVNGSGYQRRRGTLEELAVRAALDQSPELVVKVMKELKRMAVDPRVDGRVMKNVFRFEDDAEMREGLREFGSGLALGLKLRQRTGRVPMERAYEVPGVEALRREFGREGREKGMGRRGGRGKGGRRQSNGRGFAQEERGEVGDGF